MKTLMISAAVATMTLAGAATADTAQFAAQHFAQSHDQGDRRAAPTLTSEAEIVSTKGNDLAAFARAKLENGPEDDR